MSVQKSTLLVLESQMRFDQPIGPQSARDAKTAWAGGWLDANPFGSYYTNPATGLAAYHTGADLNLIGDADAHTSIYASADGVVVFAGALAVWGNVIVIKHAADSVWTRYGHVEGMAVKAGDAVKRGQPIARVGNANGTMAYHLHFDVAKVDLGAKPGDWPGTDKARLMRDYVDPKQWINAHREGDILATRGDPRIQYGRTYNALHPSVTLDQAKAILAQVWANGETVGKSFDDAGIGNLDVRVARLWGVPDAERSNYASFYSTYYPGVQVQFSNPNQPPPVVTGKAAIGIHCIHRHDIAERELARGCPIVVVMDGKVSARNMALAHPNQKVVYRRWIGTSWPTPTEMVNLLEVASDDPPNLLYVGLNEGDAPGTGDLKARAAWDTEVAKRIKDKGSKSLYLAGSLGHGNPPGDFETIWGPFGDAYRSGYNAGLYGFDLHGYSCGRPLRAGQYEPPIYFETRWQRFFTHAGFDPRIRAIYQTEAGIEGGCKAGGIGGGFPANNYTQAEFQAWLLYWLELQRAPITVNGVQYQSPFVAGAIFQAGDTNTLLIDKSTPDWVAEYWKLERAKRGLDDGFVAQAGWAGYNVDSDKYLVPLRATW